MGALLEKYKMMYYDALEQSDGDAVPVVHPDIWISAKWASDTGDHPCKPDYRDKLRDLCCVDCEMAFVVMRGNDASLATAKMYPEEYIEN